MTSQPSAMLLSPVFQRCWEMRYMHVQTQKYITYIISRTRTHVSTQTVHTHPFTHSHIHTHTQAHIHTHPHTHIHAAEILIIIHQCLPSFSQASEPGHCTTITAFVWANASSEIAR